MIEDKPIFLIDSNILIYAYDKSDSIKNPIAGKILTELFKNKTSAAISTQIVSEFFVNVTRKIEKPISKREAYYIIQEITSMSNIKILTIEKQTILNATNLSEEFSMSYWDSLIASVMKENKVFTIITENEKDFKKIPWLTIINPFK